MSLFYLIPCPAFKTFHLVLLRMILFSDSGILPADQMNETYSSGQNFKYAQIEKKLSTF